MTLLSRWLAPAVMAAGMGVAALAPGAAHAQSNDLMRVIVDVADVMMRGGQPYYRHSDYGHEDRLVMGRDRYGRPVYYRVAPQQNHYGAAPRGHAYGYYRNAPQSRRTTCNKHGKCKVEYYDPRYDRRAGHYDNRYDHRYDDRYGRVYSGDRYYSRRDRDD